MAGPSTPPSQRQDEMMVVKIHGNSVVLLSVPKHETLVDAINRANNVPQDEHMDLTTAEESSSVKFSEMLPILHLQENRITMIDDDGQLVGLTVFPDSREQMGHLLDRLTATSSSAGSNGGGGGGKALSSSSSKRGGGGGGLKVELSQHAILQMQERGFQEVEVVAAVRRVYNARKKSHTTSNSSSTTTTNSNADASTTISAPGATKRCFISTPHGRMVVVASSPPENPSQILVITVYMVNEAVRQAYNRLYQRASGVRRRCWVVGKEEGRVVSRAISSSVCRRR